MSSPGSTGSTRSTVRVRRPASYSQELRGLLREREAHAKGERKARRTNGNEEVVERLRTALARDIIGM